MPLPSTAPSSRYQTKLAVAPEGVVEAVTVWPTVGAVLLRVTAVMGVLAGVEPDCTAAQELTAVPV